MRSTKPQVKPYKWGGSSSRWVVDGMRDESGARLRKFFPTRLAAAEWLAGKRPEMVSQGRAALSLSDAQRVDANKALEVLAPYGVSLFVAASAFADRAKLLGRTVNFAKLRKELLNTQEADGASESHLTDIRNRLAHAGKTFDDRPVSSIEGREIDDWLRALPLSTVSRNNFRKVLRSAFAFALDRGYLAENPVLKTKKAKEKSAPPGILTPLEIQALLTQAPPKIIPSLAVAAFAGLRDAEIGRLTWDKIDLAGGHIKIDATIAKTASRRLVPITDNLRAWLTPYAQKDGPVRPHYRHVVYLRQEAQKRAAVALAEAGVKTASLVNWPNNALRHSYASYRLAITSNAAQTAEECGHSTVILKKNYRELVSKAEATEWFAVVPSADAANVVPFAKSAGA